MRGCRLCSFKCENEGAYFCVRDRNSRHAKRAQDAPLIAFGGGGEGSCKEQGDGIARMRGEMRGVRGNLMPSRGSTIEVRREELPPNNSRQPRVRLPALGQEKHLPCRCFLWWRCGEFRHKSRQRSSSAFVRAIETSRTVVKGESVLLRKSPNLRARTNSTLWLINGNGRGIRF